jgi:hypothetical protein
MLLQLMAVAALSAPSPVGPRPSPIGVTRVSDVVTDTSFQTDSVFKSDTVPRRKRQRAIEYSDAYYTRLRIHQIASYTELPLFASEWILGDRLLRAERTGFPSQSLKTSHQAVALGLGALFTINTITGGWNLWDSRADPAGRTLRLVHSVAMLGADAGFAWAGASGGGAKNSQADADHHRSIAIGSMALATAGTLMMWLLHD